VRARDATGRSARDEAEERLPKGHGARRARTGSLTERRFGDFLPPPRPGLGKHFGADPRRERALLGSTSFLLTWITVRAITHAIRDGRGPFGNIAPGGKHIHHMTFGITGLLATGFLWMQEIGVGTQGGLRAS